MSDMVAVLEMVVVVMVVVVVVVVMAALEMVVIVVVVSVFCICGSTVVKEALVPFFGLSMIYVCVDLLSQVSMPCNAWCCVVLCLSY